MFLRLAHGAPWEPPQEPRFSLPWDCKMLSGQVGLFCFSFWGQWERRVSRAAKIPLGDAQQGEDEPEVDAQNRGDLGRTLPKLGFSQVEGPGHHPCAKLDEHHRQESFGDLFPGERPSRVSGRGFLPWQKAAQAEGRVSGARSVPVPTISHTSNAPRDITLPSLNFGGPRAPYLSVGGRAVSGWVGGR